MLDLGVLFRWLALSLPLLATAASTAQRLDFSRATQRVIAVDGDCRFHPGDDQDGKLGWASAAFDDSAWQTMVRWPTVQSREPNFWLRCRFDPALGFARHSAGPPGLRRLLLPTLPQRPLPRGLRQHPRRQSYLRHRPSILSLRVFGPLAPVPYCSPHRGLPHQLRPAASSPTHPRSQRRPSRPVHCPHRPRCSRQIRHLA